MAGFRVFLITTLIVLLGYTGVVIADHGFNLLPVFFGDISRVGWPGQFNADFLGMLTLSALWTSWRSRFSGAGLALGVLAFCLGTPFLCVYLLILITKANGDMREVLLGRARSSAA